MPRPRVRIAGPWNAPREARHFFGESAANGDRVRGKDYNIGLRGGLIDRRHYDRMGSAIWLYAWLILRQTHQQEDTGWVLGGSPVTYREIEEETGFHSRTLERWMRTLRRNGYIETRAVASGIVVQVTKAKKSTRFPQGLRKSAERLREVADGCTQSLCESPANSTSNQELAQPIDRISLERSIEKDEKQVFHRDFHSPSKNFASTPQRPDKPTSFKENQTGKTAASSSARPQPPRQPQPEYLPNWEQLKYLVEARRQLMRAERDEEIRRELAVGKGPEVRRR